MASIFDKWNKVVDGAALANDVKEVESNGGTAERKEVPLGDYEVKIDKMELKESSKGDPMFTCWFRILTGGNKNSIMFMNQVITQGFQIHIVNDFLKSLDTDVFVEFDGNYANYNETIMDVMEAVDGKFEYLVNYAQNKKGFNIYTIKEVFEV